MSNQASNQGDRRGAGHDTRGRACSPDNTIPEWLQAEVREYRLPFIEPPRRIADIGANVGAFALMAKEEWPDARVTAFEPVAENFAALLKNTEWTGVFRVRAAVRSFDGSDLICVGGEMGVRSGFHELATESDVHVLEEVPCISAANLRRFDFIKIDTEGCELEILEHLDLSETKAIALEYHRAGDIELIKAIAKANGFELFSERAATAEVGTLVFARAGVLRTPKLFVAVPCYGSVPVQFMQCMIRLVTETPCNLTVRFVPGDSLVSRARNTLTADFLSTDCTHLLFIDSDLVFSPEHIARLLAHCEKVVGGFYPKKQDGALQWVCNALAEHPYADGRGLQRVRYMGTGFLMVERCVFAAMLEELGEAIAYTADQTGRAEHDFWAVGPYGFPDGSTRYLSEDWYFCQRVLDLGVPVYGDTRVILKHLGSACYPLQSQEVAVTLTAAIAEEADDRGLMTDDRPTELAGRG